MNEGQELRQEAAKYLLSSWSTGWINTGFGHEQQQILELGGEEMPLRENTSPTLCAPHFPGAGCEF